MRETTVFLEKTKVYNKIYYNLQIHIRMKKNKKKLQKKNKIVKKKNVSHPAKLNNSVSERNSTSLVAGIPEMVNAGSHFFYEDCVAIAVY
jgi:hypothetical protein